MLLRLLRSILLADNNLLVSWGHCLDTLKKKSLTKRSDALEVNC